MDAAYEAYDFTQCQRSDGTIYGTSGKCKQKGSKEVSANKGGEGGGGRKSRGALEVSKSLAALEKGTAEDIDVRMGKKTFDEDLEKLIGGLGTDALRTQITKAAKASKGGSNAAAQKVVVKAFDSLAKIKKGEKKSVPSVTSMVDGSDLKRLGIDPDKANSLAKAGKSISGAISRQARDFSEDFTQCQRTDGSIYGTAGECKQKGSREVSTKKQNKLFSDSNTNREGVGNLLKSLGAGPNTFSPSKNQVEEHVDYSLSKIKQAAPKMREGDLRSTIQESKGAIKLAEKQAKGKDSAKAKIVKKGLKDAIGVLYKEMTKRQKAEGKKPESLTSMLSNENLKKIG